MGWDRGGGRRREGREGAGKGRAVGTPRVSNAIVTPSCSIPLNVSRQAHLPPSLHARVAPRRASHSSVARDVRGT